MNNLYSNYTIEQLREELGKLKEKLQKAEQLGHVNKVAVYERKTQIVMSYMMNPDQFKPGDIHQLKNDPGYKFKINKINGVMAWGHRINLLGETLEREEALPISVLDENPVK